MDAKAIEAKRRHEKEVVTQMIEIYCSGNRHEDRGDWGAANCRNPRFGPEGHYRLCPDCARLAEYSCTRTQVCPRTAVKTFCKNCPIRCYEETEQEEIRTVMRFSGPRIMLHHPVDGVYHCMCSVLKKEKK